MAAKGKIKVTESELSQVMPKSWLPSEIPESLAFEIAYEIREYILNRVANGRGLGNKEFKPNVYSEAYQKSEDFKIFGKKPSPVNMELTGDMLRSIRIDVVDGMPAIILDDPAVTPRAHGHQTGQYGKGPLPKREFFGVTKDEFTENILPKFKAALQNVEPKLSVEKITYDIDDILKKVENLPINKIIKLIR